MVKLRTSNTRQKPCMKSEQGNGVHIAHMSKNADTQLNKQGMVRHK